MLSINIERVGTNNRLIMTMTTSIIHKLFVDVQIHNIFHKLIQFHLCKFYALTMLQELNNNLKVIIKKIDIYKNI